MMSFIRKLEVYMYLEIFFIFSNFRKFFEIYNFKKEFYIILKWRQTAIYRSKEKHIGNIFIYFIFRRLHKIFQKVLMANLRQSFWMYENFPLVISLQCKAESSRASKFKLILVHIHKFE